MDELRDFGVPAADLLNARHSETAREADAVSGAPRREYFAKAARALPVEDRRARSAGPDHGRNLPRVAARTGARRFSGPLHRTSLTPMRKFWIAWKTWVAA